MNPKPVAFGVVGVGGMGAAHAAFLCQMEEARLVAVTDSDCLAAKKVALQWNCAVESDYLALMNRGDIEAVIIATPHPLHAAMTLAAASRGIHVLCEKPLADSVASADAMIEACRVGGVLLGTVFQQRTDPSRRTLKRMMERGELGELHRVSLSVCYYRPQSYYDSAPWRGTWNGEGGGILMQAAHALDQLAWLAGSPARVQALTLTRLHEIGVENTVVSILDYGKGKAGWFYISTADTLQTERIEISGDRGALVWEEGRLRHFGVPQPMSSHLKSAPFMFEPLGGKWREIEIEPELQNEPQGHREVVRCFSRAVQAGDASLLIASGEDGLRSLELANAMALSGNCGGAVELPLDRERYEALLQSLRAQELAGTQGASRQSCGAADEAASEDKSPEV